MDGGDHLSLREVEFGTRMSVLVLENIKWPSLSADCVAQTTLFGGGVPGYGRGSGNEFKKLTQPCKSTILQ